MLLWNEIDIIVAVYYSIAMRNEQLSRLRNNKFSNSSKTFAIQLLCLYEIDGVYRGVNDVIVPVT